MRFPAPMRPARSTPSQSLRPLAAFELAKGCGALLAVLVSHVQWNLAVNTTGVLAAIAHWARSAHGPLTWTFLAYAGMRMVEGAGLWAGYRWARWLSIAGYASAIPLELWQLLAAPRWWTLPVLGINVGVVVLLVLLQRARARHPSGAPKAASSS